MRPDGKQQSADLRPVFHELELNDRSRYLARVVVAQPLQYLLEADALVEYFRLSRPARRCSRFVAATAGNGDREEDDDQK